MSRNFLFYVIVLLLFGTGILLVLKYGSQLQADRTLVLAPLAAQSTVSPTDIGRALVENLRHPLSVLLLQIIVIIGLAKMLGALFLKIAQPTVIGEMVAGILLGPSLLGMLFPEVQTFLFPPASLDSLKLLSQIGVILFMFVVGIELDLRHIRQKAQAAVLVSHASIIIPFFLGAAFSLLIYRALAPSQISFIAFALFMGIAMSITAFPVLARIIAERGLSGSPLGNITIACAAVDDVTAWCILAVVVTIVKAAGLGNALLTLVLAVLFVSVMLFLIRPRVDRMIGEDADNWIRGRTFMASLLVFVFASALLTEVIGIHALFGAFLAGAILPAHTHLQSFLKERLETFSSVFLLPLFFAFTGLRTQIDLLGDWQNWLTCAGIITIAIAGKLGGSMLAARWTGMNWCDAFSIGALMNTRGLMELIVLNIGYDLSILSPQVFTMMVLMALVTTLMTGPLLSLLGYSPRSLDGAELAKRNPGSSGHDHHLGHSPRRAH